MMLCVGKRLKTWATSQSVSTGECAKRAKMSQTKGKGGPEAVLTAYQCNERRRIQRQAAIVTQRKQERKDNQTKLRSL